MRTYWAAVIGNILEHYDQALYGFLVPFLAPLFFPHADPIYSLLASYVLLPIGLISKPIGAYVFGRIGDRYGRKMSLSITLVGMAATTGAMGCIPTFEQAGWIAPALLSLGRLCQNFFAAGEVTGGALFLLEKTPKAKQGLISSFFDASGIAGILIAALGATLIGENHWRELFWCGSLAAIIGLVIYRIPISNATKQNIGQSEALDQPIVDTAGYAKNPNKNTTSYQWKKEDWRPMLAIILASGFSYANYYLVTTFLNGFLPLVSRVTTQEALALNSFLLIADLLLLPFFGWLSIHIAKEWLMIAATTSATCLACPLFLILDDASAWTVGTIRIIFTIIGVCFSAPYHAWAMNICPKERRFTICAMGSAIGSRFIGAMMPAIGIWLYSQTNWIASPSIIIIATALLASGAVAYEKKRNLLSTGKLDQKNNHASLKPS